MRKENNRDRGNHHRGCYEEYDHSDEELYVYDQCCDNCRFGHDGICSQIYKYGDRKKLTSDWCPDWKGRNR